MRIGLERFKALGFKAKEIRLTGGGAKSPLWRSIAANVTKLPVRIPRSAEAAALGGAIQALWCLGKKVTIETLADEHVALEESASVKPDKKDAAAYDKAYGAYTRYLDVLSPLYK
jgi:xylulokinase